MLALAIICALTVYFLLRAVLYRMGVDSDRRKSRLNEVKTAQSGENRADRKKDGEKLGKLKNFRAAILNRQRSKVLGQQINNSRTKKKLTEAEKMLLIADIQLTSRQFNLVKLLLGALFFGVIYGVSVKLRLNSALIPLLALGGGILGDILPAEWLKSRVKKRKALYRDELPDVMDLLVVSVEAGLGFDSALLRLYEKNKSPLMQELMRAMQDMQYGMTKKEAYTNLSERCGVKELTSFVNALIQADQMGISVRSVLKSQSEALREERRQRAEEQALKAPVKMLLPLVVFIFPVIFIIILGPAAMNIMEVMG